MRRQNSVSYFLKTNNNLALKFGALTAVAIIVFKLLAHLVIYDSFSFDYYMAFVALCFLVAGIKFGSGLATKKTGAKNEGQEAGSTYKSQLYSLTARELSIFKLIGAGKSNKEIAEMSYVELSTVKTHVNNLYSKLDIKNRKEARQKYCEMVESGLNP